MPPWLPRGPLNQFRGDRRLSESERSTLLDWLARLDEPGSLPDAGSAIEPEAVSWQLGPPSLVLETERLTVAPGARDVFRNLVVTPPIERPLWVKGVELRPVGPEAVHHAVVTLDRTSSSRELDALDPEPGFDGMDPLSQARSPGGQFLGWTPGKTARMAEAGVAWRLEPGDDIVALLHVLPQEDEISVGLEIGLHFTDDAPTKAPVMLRLGSMSQRIDAEASSEVADSFVLPAAATLVSLYPHAHYLARSFRATAETPDGRRVDLLDLPDWDFHWQDQYTLTHPLELEAGTRLDLSIRYSNPGARRVRYGPSSSDVMGDLWVELYPRQADPEPLGRAARMHELRNLESGYRQDLEEVRRAGGLPERSTDALHFLLAGVLLQQGRNAEAEQELERVLQIAPDHVGALTNLGNQRLARGDPAVDLLQRARTLAPHDAHVTFNLANALRQEDRLEEALAAYDEAVAVEPSFAAAWLNRGLVLRRLGRHEAQIRSFLRAAELEPGNPSAHANLGIVFVELGMFDEADLAAGQALRLLPGNGDLQRLRARALVGRAQRAEGEQQRDLAEEALRLDPANPEARRLAGAGDG